MHMTRRQNLGLLAGAACAIALPLGAPRLIGTAWAANHAPALHEVLMLNADPDNKRERNVFSPDLLQIKPGDTVKFLATDRGHNAQVDTKMMPEGATKWKGRINEEIEVLFQTEGAYGYYCQPHRGLGMVGLILVGDPTANYDDIKRVRQRGKAKARYADIFARADALLAAKR